MTGEWIAAPFPAPPGLLANTFAELRIAAEGDESERARTLAERHPDQLERPWEPATLAPTLAEHLWAWLEQVAGWLNHEYSWRTDTTIPACWPAHPHLAHELAALAALRWQAHFDPTPAKLEDWHRWALPGFYTRMAERLGSPGCPPGEHDDWPGAARHRDYTSPAATGHRAARIEADLTARRAQHERRDGQ